MSELLLLNRKSLMISNRYLSVLGLYCSIGGDLHRRLSLASLEPDFCLLFLLHRHLLRIRDSAPNTTPINGRVRRIPFPRRGAAAALRPGPAAHRPVRSGDGVLVPRRQRSTAPSRHPFCVGSSLVGSAGAALGPDPSASLVGGSRRCVADEASQSGEAADAVHEEVRSHGS